MGTLLGLFPGVIYESLDVYKRQVFQNKVKQQEEADFYNIMHRFDNTVIAMNEDLPYPFIQGDCLSDYVNLD